MAKSNESFAPTAPSGDGAAQSRSGDGDAAPRNEQEVAYRIAHPQAKAIFNLLRHAPEIDRRHVLIASRSRAIEAAAPTAQLTLNALRTCLADQGRISRGVYDKWRASQPDPKEWPSSQRIINIFKTWRRALDAAGADVVGEVLSRRLLANGQPYTSQEILDAVKAYAATGGRLTWDSA